MVALITGGASGIGYEITNYLLRMGYTIYLNYLTSIDNANQLKNDYPNQVVLTHGDITDEAYIKNVLNQIKQEQGSLDLLINNAAFEEDNLIKNKTKASFIKELDTNLVAPFLLTKYYSELFKTGMIVNLLSTDGVDTYHEYNLGYAASKAGLSNLTKSTAYSLKDFKVYGLMLNYVNTNSVNGMDQEFLKLELMRINQPKLIEVGTVIKHFDGLINGNYESGYIERIDNNE